MHIVFRNKKRVLSDINMLNTLYDDLYSDNFEYISNIFSDLVNLYNFENCGTNLKANFSDKAVTDSLAFINDNFSERFSLAQLAEKCEISNSQFIRRFKAATGITPSEYLLKVRLSHAKQLLLNSDLLIKEIAQLCGFENEYYFSNFFKKNMKLSPKNYRKMYMNF
jgi:transcriptional regulator GlxA family with amidase domain